MTVKNKAQFVLFDVRPKETELIQGLKFYND